MCPLSLFFPQGIALFALFWGRTWQSNADLALKQGTEADADHLVHHGDDVIGNVGALKVASTMATLSADALGYGMDRNQGDGR